MPSSPGGEGEEALTTSYNNEVWDSDSTRDEELEGKERRNENEEKKAFGAIYPRLLQCLSFAVVEQTAASNQSSSAERNNNISNNNNMIADLASPSQDHHADTISTASTTSTHTRTGDIQTRTDIDDEKHLLRKSASGPECESMSRKSAPDLQGSIFSGSDTSCSISSSYWCDFKSFVESLKKRARPENINNPGRETKRR